MIDLIQEWYDANDGELFLLEEFPNLAKLLIQLGLRDHIAYNGALIVLSRNHNGYHWIPPVSFHELSEEERLVVTICYLATR